jgi:DNA-binding NarL/FixJ family response regulator
MIRVLLAEDHETVREGLRLLVNNQRDMQVVGEASDGRSALEKAGTAQPDVLVLDLTMPEMNGLATARAMKASGSPVRIVALTRHDDEAFVQELLAYGASAYVLKQSPSLELLRAIRVAASGGQYLDAALTAPKPSRDHHRPGVTRAITNREQEVLRLMAAGHSNKEIAARLDISIKTVEVHKGNAMRKLGMHGRTDVIKYAVLNGWLKDP